MSPSADRSEPARPCLATNFSVEIDEGNGRVLEIGCAEVEFPRFLVPGSTADGGAGSTDSTGPLVLRRASSGSLELYAWWHRACQGRAPQRRTVRVRLLAPDHEGTVLTWRFRNVRPVALAYSPLRANEAKLLVEAIELAFDSVEMA